MGKRSVNCEVSEPPGKVGTCPADDGSVETLTFLYGTGPDVQVSYNLTGCQFVTKDVLTSKFPSAELKNQSSNVLTAQH